MAIQLGGAAKAALVAHLAFMRLLLAVAALVGNQIARVAETPAADIAAVRLLARMGEHVLLVARLLGQPLATDGALERLDAAVREQVRAKRRGLPVHLAAGGAPVRVVGIMQRHMAVVGVAGLEGFAADLADKGRGRAVQLHVVLEGVAGAQLLVADLQRLDF